MRLKKALKRSVWTQVGNGILISLLYLRHFFTSQISTMLRPSWPKYQPISEPETPHVITSYQSSRFIIHGSCHCYCASIVRTLYMTWRVMYFKRAQQVETQQNIELMTFAVTWSANIFVGCSVTPTFFRQITSFSDSFHYTKKQKKSVRGKF